MSGTGEEAAMGDDLAEQIGRRIRQARLAANLRQQDVADRVGLTRSSVTNIEAGRQTVQIDSLVALARVLGVTVGALVGETALPTSTVAHEFVLTTDAADRRRGWRLVWECVRRDCDERGNLTVPDRDKAMDLFKILDDAHRTLAGQDGSE